MLVYSWRSFNIGSLVAVRRHGAVSWSSSLSTVLTPMDKFSTLEPTRLHGTGTSASPSPYGTAAKPRLPPPPIQPLIGRLPSDIHLLILAFTPVYAVPAYARVSRAISRLARDERTWQRRHKCLARVKGAEGVLERLEEAAAVPPPKVATVAAESLDDEFGDFASVSLSALNAPAPVPPPPPSLFAAFDTPAIKQSPSDSALLNFKRFHGLLKPLVKLVARNGGTPSAVLDALFPSSPTQQPPDPQAQANTLTLLAAFLSPFIQPTKNWTDTKQALLQASDRLDASLLSTFERGSAADAEEVMRSAAHASWALHHYTSAPSARWELATTFLDALGMFYGSISTEKADDNFTSPEGLLVEPPPRPLDRFVDGVLEQVKEAAGRAVRVFPPEANVLSLLGERTASDVVCWTSHKRLYAP